jgi:hypothetical protein
MIVGSDYVAMLKQTHMQTNDSNCIVGYSVGDGTGQTALTPVGTSGPSTSGTMFLVINNHTYCL